MRIKQLVLACLALCLTVSLSFAATEEGEVVEIKMDTFTIKRKDGRGFAFGVTEKLAKEGNPKSRFYPHSFKDLKLGQEVRVEFGTVKGKFVAERLRIVKQVKDDPEPNRKK